MMEGLVLIDFKTVRYHCDVEEDCEVNIYRQADNPEQAVIVILHTCPVIGRGTSLDVRRWRVIMDALSERANELTKDL
jgi:hypothetical protein